jgi:leucyl aminopeptidase
LADCLTWVQRKYNPDIIIDIATLTGACMAALGENFGGIFGNNDSLISAIQEIGKIKYENVFNLPLIEEHKQELKCGDADINSMGSKYAGASTAAAFLSEFIENENTKWIHLDIAGPAMRSKKNYWFNENGTGFGVRLIYYYLKSLVS